MKKPSHLTLIALRHSLKHPIQSLLLILGVALGVAMIIAVDLANSSASQAFMLSTDSIAGRATHQIVAAPGDVPTWLYEEFRIKQGLRTIAPVVTGQVNLVAANNLPLQLLGVDPLAEAPFRNYMGANVGGGQGVLPVETLTQLLIEPGTVLLSQTLGDELALKAGDTFSIAINGKIHTVRLAALLTPSDDLSRRALNRFLLADISTAQELLEMQGFVSHIDLILSSNQDPQPLLDLLPPTVQLQRAKLRNETLDQLTAAFELNLTALSLLGVVVGIFLIYNTISFSVVQRRPVLGMLRCLGVTRREIFSLVLIEALALSALGVLIGIGLGIILGRGLVGLVTQTINDLFFNLTVQDISLQPLTLYKGVIAGLGSGLLAAFIPAVEAMTIPPISTLKRSTTEIRLQKLLPWLSLGGLVFGLIGGGLLMLPTQSIGVSFSALFFIVVGMAFLTPLYTKLFLLLLMPLIKSWLGIVGLMAARDIGRALSRTAVTIAALMIAVSVIIGVSVMIASFRSTVVDWLDTILVADIFISPSNGLSAIDPAFVEAVRNHEAIIEVELGRTATVFAPAHGQVQINAFTGASVAEGSGDNFYWSHGTSSEALASLNQGHVLVSEVFARQHSLPLNRPSEIVLQTVNGPHSFQISGIFYNYSPRGFILMEYDVYQRFWDDDTISNVALYIQPDGNSDYLAAELQRQFSADYQVNIVSNRGLKESAIVVFDRTFTITAALRLLATLVAFVGVLSALMSLQLEKTKILGTLRANGMTLRQMWRFTFVETGLIGLTSGIIAIPTGLIMAIILIYVINLRSFGWSLQLQLSPQIFFTALLVALSASLIAGIYPAFRLNKMVIAAALREE